MVWGTKTFFTKFSPIPGRAVLGRRSQAAKSPCRAKNAGKGEFCSASGAKEGKPTEMGFPLTFLFKKRDVCERALWAMKRAIRSGSIPRLAERILGANAEP